MGSNIGSDSGSEADFQEPNMKPTEVTEIPDSDAEDAGTADPLSASATKLKGIIEHINADSDDDGDEPDRPIDFGEEEEEDEAAPSAKLSTPENKADHPEEQEEPEEMDLEPEEKKPRSPTSSKKATSPSSSKSRSKKATNVSPSKAIKKTSATARGKTKAPKKATATKKSAPLLKSVGKASSSLKSQSPKKASPKPQKKSTAKTATKVGTKSSQKTTKRDESKQVVQKTKVAKPKKTITKTVKQGHEKGSVKQNEKSKTPIKTFSKKAKANNKKTSDPEPSKGRKTKTPNTDSRKENTPKKMKAKKAGKQVEDEEDTGKMEIESEGEVSDANSDADDEEATYTPKSKLPIIGSLACSSRDLNAQALLDHAVQQLGKYRVVNYGPDSDVILHGYIIGEGTKRSWGVLQALVSGAHMISEDWLSSSISEGCWQPMVPFISDRFGKSPRSVKGADNRILEGLRIKVACEDKDASSVRKLVTLCGARVAETRIDVTINDTGKAMDIGTNVTKKWLADSVEAGVAVEYQPYLVPGSG